MWNYKKANFDSFREDLSQFDWSVCLNPGFTLDEMADKWSNEFLKIANKSVPNKLVTIRPEDKPWYTNKLRCKRRHMMKLYKVAKPHNHGLKWENYKTVRNEYFSEIKIAKKCFETEQLKSLADEKNKPKQWWSLIKQIHQSNSSHEGIPPLEVDENILTDDKDKANAFNNFFLRASTLDESNAKLPDQDRIVIENDLTEITITEADVLDQLNVIDTTKAYGFDGIPPKLLKEGRKAICRSLCILFNLSLSFKKVPSCWKKSNVVPIFKKVNPSIVENYRPISLISTLSKTMERIIFKYVYNYFRTNFILSDNQSGFQPGRSTVTQLIEIYHEFCRSAEAGKEIRVIFLDISKAFDRVWHSGLLYKLKLAGINGDLLEWFKNYLSNRYQRVVINGQHSEWGSINAGVPQGSVLGPLLFLVYINDIVSTVSHCNVRLFTDDTCLFLEVNNREVTAQHITEDLSCISSWSDQWLINFSAPKTKALTISNKRNAKNNPPIIFKNEEIEEISSHVYLGLKFSKNLKWNNHIEDVAVKARKKLNAMLPLKFKLDRLSLEIMYNSFVRPSMEYASQVWGGTYQSDISKLEKIQIDALRVITGATARSNILALYNDTGFVTLQVRITNSMLVLMWKMRNGLCPSYLSDLVHSNEHREHYNLRSQETVRTPFARLETFKRSFVPHTCSIWNTLPLNVQNAGSLEGFKQYLCKKSNPINKLFYFGERWPSVHHARLRIGCSKLNGDLYHNLHVIDSPRCDCGSPLEDATHFFFHCPLFQNARQDLIASVQILTVATLDTLLFGKIELTLKNNQDICLAVHNFIGVSKRFE